MDAIEIKQHFLSCLRSFSTQGDAERFNSLLETVKIVDSKVQFDNKVASGLSGDAQTGLENALRVRLDDYFRADVSVNKQIIFENIDQLMLLCIACTKANLTRGAAAFVLMQDVFEYLSTSECKEWFNFVEKHVDEFADIVSKFTNPNANVNGLAVRAMTGLMRRLSKTDDLVFCGRLSLALGRIIPLSDRSGVNLRGAVNTSNITVFTPEIRIDSDKMDSVREDGEQAEMKDTQDLRVEREKPNEEEEKGEISIDNYFHYQFWSLMKYLQDPMSALSTPKDWDNTCLYIKQVIKAFTTITGLQNEEAAEIVQSDAYFTKFLTSPKLINHEIQDPYFRRHVLVQLLIFFQALQRSSSKTKESALSDTRKATIEDYEKKTRSLLEKTAVGSKRFASTVSHILKREENWVTWKRDGCPTFEQPRAATLPSLSPTTPTFTQSKKRKAADTERKDQSEAKRQKVVSMGNPDLDALWNQNVSLEDFEGHPTINKILEHVVVDLLHPDPEMVDMLPTKSKVFQWKATRILANQRYTVVKQFSNKNLHDVLIDNATTICPNINVSSGNQTN